MADETTPPVPNRPDDLSAATPASEAKTDAATPPPAQDALHAALHEPLAAFEQHVAEASLPALTTVAETLAEPQEAAQPEAMHRMVLLEKQFNARLAQIIEESQALEAANEPQPDKELAMALSKRFTTALHKVREAHTANHPAPTAEMPDQPGEVPAAHVTANATTLDTPEEVPVADAPDEAAAPMVSAEATAPEADAIPVAHVETDATTVEHPGETSPEEATGKESAPPQEEDEPARDAQDAAKDALLQDVLAEDYTAFTDRLENASLPELALLMEELSEAELGREIVRKVGAVKRKFDQRIAQALEEVREASADNPELTDRKEQHILLSNRFSTALGTYNRRKAEHEKALEAEKTQNSLVKGKLLDELRDIVHNEKVQAIKRVREIQTQWRETGPVLPQDSENFFQSYRALLDQFFTLRDGYLDLLKQDRKINLEQKQALIEEMKALVPEDSATKPVEFWQQALEQVRDLHARWKQVGPVPREQSEIVWQLFKQATDGFYLARRGFFEIRDAERNENAAKKKALLAQAQELAAFESEDLNAWRSKSSEMKKVQEAWRSSGPVPFKVMNDFNKAFREALDTFYDKRSGYFSELDKEKEEQLKQKEALLDQARDLKNSGKSNGEIADGLKRLQREWKSTGPDVFREARKLRKKFRKSCDTFFNKLKADQENARAAEQQNLDQKKAIADEISSLLNAPNAAEQSAVIEEKMAAWMAVGPVPFKARDKAESHFMKLVDRYFALQETDPDKRRELADAWRFKMLKGRPNAGERIVREEQKFMRKRKELEEQLAQFENNIQLIIPGRKGEGLRKTIQQSIQQTQDELADVKRKIKELRKLKNEAKSAEQSPAAASAHLSSQQMGASSSAPPSTEGFPQAATPTHAEEPTPKEAVPPVAPEAAQAPSHEEETPDA